MSNKFSYIVISGMLVFFSVNSFSTERLQFNTDIPKDTMVTHYDGKKITRPEYNALHAKKEHWYVFTMPECSKERVQYKACQHLQILIV